MSRNFLASVLVLASATFASGADHFDLDRVRWEAYAYAKAQITPNTGSSKTSSHTDKEPTGGSTGTTTFANPQIADTGTQDESDQQGPVGGPYEYCSAATRTTAEVDYSIGTSVSAEVDYIDMDVANNDGHTTYKKALVDNSGAAAMIQYCDADFDTETTWHDVCVSLYHRIRHSPDHDAAGAPPFSGFDGGYLYAGCGPYHYFISEWATDLGSGNNENGWDRRWALIDSAGYTDIDSDELLTGDAVDDDLGYNTTTKFTYIEMKHGDELKLNAYVNDSNPDSFTGGYEEYRDDADAAGGAEYYGHSVCDFKASCSIYSITDTGNPF